MKAQPPQEASETAYLESDWISADTNHHLKKGPPHDRLPPPLLVTGPPFLNTHELHPEDFESLSYYIVCAIDKSADIHFYGKRGQTQYGIDLVALRDNKPVTIYQAKRYQNFSDRDLDKAVRKYADSPRPIEASRLVVIVSCEAQDSAVINRLISLQQEYSKLTIELWDRKKISQILLREPEIVRMFFGQATCDIFCGSRPSTVSEQTIPIESDAIVRGPIRHMNLFDDYTQAKELLETEPSRAAMIFERIAQKLKKTPFAAYAVQLRREQASALEAAGQVEQSLRIRLDISWQLIDSTDLWTAIIILRQIDSSEVELPDDLDRSARALAAVLQLRSEHTGSLDELATRFDQMEEGDLHQHTVAIALVEESIAARRTDLIQSRAAVLTRIVESQSSDNASQMVAARILMSIADATGDWEQLVVIAIEQYAPTITSLILARNARYNALASNLETATTRYLDAIERSTDERMYGDANSWLYALRTVRSHSLSFAGDINDSHRLAQATETQGVERTLAANNARARAMRAFLNRDWPDALEASRRYLWHSVVTASWTEEFEANELLGDIFAETDHPLDAARHYIRAGHREKAEKLGASLAKGGLDLSIGILGEPYWERAAAYKLVVQASDLLTETSAKEWASAALDDAIANNAESYPKKIVGTDAFEAFSALSDIASEVDSDRFIQFAAQLISRKPDSYQITDEAHIQALMRIAKNNIKLRKAALQQVLELLLVTNQLSWSAFLRQDELLKSEVQLVEKIFLIPAANGNTIACLGLIAAGADISPILTYAREKVTAAIAKRAPDSSAQDIGTSYRLEATFASVLNPVEQEEFVRGMMVVANDITQPSLDRGDALLAATQLVSGLSPGLKSELYKETIKFARGDHDPRLPIPFEGSDDPLNRFQFNLGLRSLRPSGLYCAAYCAVSDEEISEVRGLALGLLRQDDENTPAYVAHALVVLALELASETVEALSVHSDERIRAAAAVAWARGTHPPAIGQALAKDSSAFVRSSLAKELQDRPEHLPIREVLLNDPRRSIRSIVRLN